MLKHKHCYYLEISHLFNLKHANALLKKVLRLIVH